MIVVVPVPAPPDQSTLIKANSSAAVLHLDAWRRDGACPVLYFVVQYRACEAPGDWLLHSNNVVPEQRSVALPDLAPGTWYCLLMAAHSEAGATDAEYVFPTLTLTGVIVAVYACGVDVEKGPIRQQLWNAPPGDNVESWFGAQSRMIPGHLYFVFRAL
ncbi:hypothetical protein LAZ67_1006056 [Cordylochernes scorpioides]|uniref:Fibronectin type-III domain-containing protein n=1 Tax=Cordylochernes scorpioides TaxID=51811 RepID=A0ABY6JYH8_9ARAC|nr:hypothetical protein LAZ67_1006056 [Cordylochernes scorpioides]